MDPAFYALDLDAPTATEARTAPAKRESYPAWEIITYEFAAKGGRPAVKLLWYDGGKMPPRPDDLDANVQLGDNGIYFVGEKGTLLSGGWAGMPGIFPKALRAAFHKPPKTIPARRDTTRNGSAPARTIGRRTPRRDSPIPARTPRRCWWDFWPSACSSGSSGMQRR